MLAKNKITLLFILVFSVALMLALSATPALAAAKIFTVTNNTGMSANDLHLAFATTPTNIIPNIPSPFTGSTAPPYTSKITFDGGTVASGDSVTFQVQTAGTDINFTAYWTLNGKIIGSKDVPMPAGGKNGLSYSYKAPAVRVCIYPYLRMTMPDMVDLGATFFGDEPAKASFPLTITSNTSWGVYVSGEDFLDDSGTGNTMPISQLGVHNGVDPLMAINNTDQLFMQGSASISVNPEYVLQPTESTPPGNYEATVHWMAVAL